MSEGINLRATAHVRLLKYDEDGKVIDIIDQDVELTEKEAQEIWHSQQQA